MPRTLLLASTAVLLLAAGARAEDRDARRGDRDHRGIRHVLLLSVDGMHEVDLRLWVENHPRSALAALSRHGTTYARAYTTLPSDSFPGMIAQVTGGTPKTAGVFYDDSYERTFFAPGSNCAGTPGAETTYAENIDKNTNDVSAGGILGQPLTQIDPAKLPLRLVNGACSPVLPHQFIQTNTIFEVIRAHGGHTAWSDKHPAYEILNGPSGAGIEDLYTPEINSQLPGAPAGDDYTKSFAGVRQYDQIKVDATVRQIDGLDSTGHIHTGYTPAIFGMNFQAVSVGQKLARAGYLDQPATLTGGYIDAAGRPGAALTQQLQFVDDSVALMMRELRVRGLDDETVVIVSAKHGQSPIDLSKRRAIKDGYAAVLAGDAYGFDIADDGALIWLDPAKRTPELYRKALADLQANKMALGIHSIVARDELTALYRDPFADSRTPDFLVVSDYGVIYTGGSKLAEHGGAADDDRHVALLVSAPGLSGRTVQDRVLTMQIAPTILGALRIDPSELRSVRREGTAILPGLGRGERDDRER